MVTATAAQEPPHPSNPRNWAHQLRTIDGAHIVPTEDRTLVQPCGVFDQDRSYCHDAVLWRRKPLMVPPEQPAFAEDAPLKGTYLWGGVLHGHFGHFLVESIGRLWGYAAADAHLDGVLFMEKRAERGEGGAAVAWHSEETPLLRSFQAEMFKQFGIAAPIGLVGAPVQVERLVIPGQGFGMGAMAEGTPAFRAFVQDRVGQDIAPDGPERLYISRSAFGARRGGVIGEQILEQQLEQDGFTVFHPQTESIPAQIARYKAAREVVALDGSALHLLAMVAQPDQKVAMIKRRSSPISKGIERHLASFMGQPPVVVDAIKQNWLRSDRKKVDRFSLAELDFPKLGKALNKAGFSVSRKWPKLNAKVRDETLAALSKEANHTFRPEKEEAVLKLPEGVAAVCHGIEVPESKAVGPKWLVRKINNGRYEKEEIAGALHLVSDADRVLECGAGIGIVGTTVAHNCKPEKMLSFEANPNMLEVIQSTYRHNSVDDRISLTHGALMAGEDLPEKTEFHVAERFSFSSLGTPLRELTQTVTVPVYNFAEVKSSFRPTALLMDIEGGELYFLEGADLSGINVMVMEFHPDVYGTEGMARCKTLIRQAGLEPVEEVSTETVWAARRTAEPAMTRKAG